VKSKLLPLEEVSEAFYPVRPCSCHECCDQLPQPVGQTGSKAHADRAGEATHIMLSQVLRAKEEVPELPHKNSLRREGKTPCVQSTSLTTIPQSPAGGQTPQGASSLLRNHQGPESGYECHQGCLSQGPPGCLHTACLLLPSAVSSPPLPYPPHTTASKSWMGLSGKQQIFARTIVTMVEWLK
jgi:hypothetical protein